MVIINNIAGLFFRSLSGRLISGVLSIQCVLVPLLFVAIIYVVNQGLRDQFTNEVRSTSGLLGDLLMSYDPHVQQDEITGLLDEVVLGGRIIFADLELPDGISISSLFAEPGLESRFREDYAFSQNNDEIYFVSIPLHYTAYDSPANLKIGFDEIQTRELIDQVFQRSMWLATAYIMANICLVVIFGKRLTRPLYRLRQALHRITRGHTDTPLEVDSPISDISDLAHDLDKMRNELVRQASALEHQVYHDALTSLPNRLHIEDRLNQAVLKGKRDYIPFTLLFIDLDNFKDVNDVMGHQAGDIVLKQVASRMSDALRESDTIARLGGDEFAVLLHNTDIVAAKIVAANIVHLLSQRFTVEQQPVQLGASIGIAQFPKHGSDPVGLMRRADIAMYVAKRTNAGFSVYHAGHDRNSMMRLELSNDLKEGIRKKELIPFYQPKVDLRTGKICGFEALVRWNHPERGLLSPDEFIHIAERNGMIIPMTNLMITSVLKDFSEWDVSDYPLDISINLSPMNFQDERLPSRLATYLSENPIRPHQISLELTESAILHDLEIACEILNEIKAMGVNTIIDDFGTGHSSLVNLRNLPVTELKIDMSFIRNMHQSLDDQAIVNATIGMAHDLGLEVTAEGVETAEVVEHLLALGCDKIQGYYLTVPLAVHELASWCRKYSGLSNITRVSNQ